jgi:hypothetical protein
MNERKKRLTKEMPEALLYHPTWLNPENLSEQQERSMLGQRTRFLKLHRYIDSLSDAELKTALDKVKAKFVSELKACPYDRFTDTAILEDVIHHEISLREGYSVEQLVDIRNSYLDNVEIAEQFPEVTSEHMIAELQK